MHIFDGRRQMISISVVHALSEIFIMPAGFIAIRIFFVSQAAARMAIFLTKTGFLNVQCVAAEGKKCTRLPRYVTARTSIV